MGLLKDLFELNRIRLVGENEKIRRSKKSVERQLEESLLANSEIKDKYIALLEEKCDGFDKYLHYEQECVKLSEEKRQLKKENAELRENLTHNK